MVKNSAEQCKKDSKEKTKKKTRDKIASESQEGLFGVSLGCNHLKF